MAKQVDADSQQGLACRQAQPSLANYFNISQLPAIKKWLIAALLLGLATYCLRPYFGLFLGQYILPAQKLPKEAGSQVHFQNQLLAKISPDLQLHFLKIITPDQALLDTLEISKPNLPSKNYWVFFCGNSLTYDARVLDFEKIANQTATKVIGFDYRNVRYSVGQVYSKDALIIDGIQQVQRLLDQGVAAKNITLHGLSLGGAVASLVAKHFHNQIPAQKVYLVVDRSFSTLTDAVLGKVLPELEQPQTTAHLRKIGRKLLKPFVKSLLWLTNWEMDVLEAYNQIPANHKALITAKNDTVIDYQVASLEQALIINSALKHNQALNVGKIFQIADSFKGLSLHAHSLSGLKDQQGKDMLNNLMKFLEQERVARAALLK